MRASARALPRPRFRRFRRPSGAVLFYLALAIVWLSSLAWTIIGGYGGFGLFMACLLSVLFIGDYNTYRRAKAEEEEGNAWPPPPRWQWGMVLFLLATQPFDWMNVFIK